MDTWQPQCSSRTITLSGFQPVQSGSSHDWKSVSPAFAPKGQTTDGIDKQFGDKPPSGTSFVYSGWILSSFVFLKFHQSVVASWWSTCSPTGGSAALPWRHVEAIARHFSVSSLHPHLLQLFTQLYMLGTWDQLVLVTMGQTVCTFGCSSLGRTLILMLNFHCTTWQRHNKAASPNQGCQGCWNLSQVLEWGELSLRKSIRLQQHCHWKASNHLHSTDKSLRGSVKLEHPKRSTADTLLATQKVRTEPITFLFHLSAIAELCNEVYLFYRHKKDLNTLNLTLLGHSLRANCEFCPQQLFQAARIEPIPPTAPAFGCSMFYICQ